MLSSRRALLFAAAVLTAGLTPAAQSPVPFAPFEAWKAAVLAGDESALTRLYSTRPPATAQVGRTKSANPEDEAKFWSHLASTGITDLHPKVLDVTSRAGKAVLRLRIEAVQTTGERRAMVAAMAQFWEQQPDGWRIIVTRRSDFYPDPGRRLPQPATPNTHLYAPPEEAQAELKTASAQAAREHKRVLLIFGANWCYDCHVLDTTFRSKEFAPLVEANYVVVHINIGEEGKDNNDLAQRVGVNLDKGVPSLAILEPDGTVVTAQKRGEFESTVKIGPEDVRAFLEQWKPKR